MIERLTCIHTVIEIWLRSDKISRMAKMTPKCLFSHECLRLFCGSQNDANTNQLSCCKVIVAFGAGYFLESNIEPWVLENFGGSLLVIDTPLKKIAK